MIITKTPFRISFCGGGSDMPDFYKEHTGCVLSTTINRYMYLTIHPYFYEHKTAVRYSQIEIVDDIKNIKHSIYHQVLNDMGVSGVEVSSTADVPSGTGLGSSSSFTVGLIHTLHCYQGKYIAKEDIAKEACRVEIEELGNPIGKQDQYAAAFGGLNFIEFNRDDTVSVSPIVIHQGLKEELEENLVMFYTGVTHDANAILAEQRGNIISYDDKTRNLIVMCELARNMKSSLENGNIIDFGEILNEGWIRKREMASGISNHKIDEIYDVAMSNGATGGKLLGAGGGGFMLFYCNRDKQKHLEESIKLKRFDFKFENDGTSIVYIGNKYW